MLTGKKYRQPELEELFPHPEFKVEKAPKLSLDDKS
jgi:hypothetical protein